MEFHDLFLKVRASESKDLEYSSLLSNIRECYEEFLLTGQTNPQLLDVIERIENMRFMINTNERVEFMNISQEHENFDYASEFNPSQKGAINLLLSVISSPQNGLYVKGFFALYIWKKLLPDSRFYSVGLTDNFYALAETTNLNGDLAFKPADEISRLVETKKQSLFFHMVEHEHCDASRKLIAQIDQAIKFILHQYRS